MSAIQNVAVIGGSGNLGPAIIQALLSARFAVTALTRTGSKSTFPPGVKVHETDYESDVSLAEAFEGQDAVVSTIATAASAKQQRIIDAAVKAGVKRYIPSEFGINTQKATGGIARIIGGKKAVQKQLTDAAAENAGFGWTGISTGMFFDWGLKVGSLGFALDTKRATIWDSGNEPFTGTNLPTIGLAVVAALKNPELAGRYLDIASFVTTQNEILAILEEETGAKWTVERKSTSESDKIGDDKFAKGDYSAFSDYLKGHLWGDGRGQSAKKGKLANEELGLPAEDLRATVKAGLA